VHCRASSHAGRRTARSRCRGVGADLSVSIARQVSIYVSYLAALADALTEAGMAP
jgi:hypothetical protein